jgi:hypothetical protein
MSPTRTASICPLGVSPYPKESIMAFAAFMATALGRLIRVVAGAALVLVGLAAIEGVTGWIVAAVGLGLVALGAFNYCALAPLVGGPFSGREALGHRTRLST